MKLATSKTITLFGMFYEENQAFIFFDLFFSLGMRHDGPSADNSCDPTSFIMSPTLGSGKITWSTCSKQYLQQFLQ